MKNYLVNILKDHVKNNKLDEFGTIFVAFYLISITQKRANDLKEALKEIGVKKNDN